MEEAPLLDQQQFLSYVTQALHIIDFIITAFNGSGADRKGRRERERETETDRQRFLYR